MEDDGRLLIGGDPFSIVRVSAAGAERLRAWWRGESDPTGPVERDLADRLIANGMHHPEPAGSDASGPDLRITVVIPCRDDAAGLRATLGAISTHELLGAPIDRVVVVDDGSVAPVAVGRADGGLAVEVVRSDEAGGPGAARERGRRWVGSTDDEHRILLFVDAGVEPGDLRPVLGHLRRAEVVACAPRVVSGESGGVGAAGVAGRWIERYEHRRSPLDLRSDPSIVAPGRRVAYVPTACLAVRATALAAVGGFDEGLRFGEDVDLVWRLARHGEVRYEPRSLATHPPRRSVGAFVRQRVGYGSSAGPLARRHGAAVAPWVGSLEHGAAAVAVAVGWWPVALGLAAVPVVRLRAVLRPTEGGRGVGSPAPTARAVRIGVGAAAGVARRTAEALGRVWWPVVLVAALPGSPVAGRARRALVVGWGRHLVGGRRPDDLALAVVDDVAYGVGVWGGVLGGGRPWSARAALVPRRWRPQPSSRNRSRS